MSTISADRLIGLHEQLQGAATALGLVANELTAYVPKAFPAEPLSDVVILVSNHGCPRFRAAVAHKTLEMKPEGEGRAA